MANLKYDLVEAGKQKRSALLTFDGAYSNRIRAAAEAGRYCHFPVESRPVEPEAECVTNFPAQIRSTP